MHRARQHACRWRYTAAELKLLNTLALQTATAIENARLFERTVQAARERERLLALHQEAEVARAKLESELKLAARIQADLFPPCCRTSHGYELAARNRPARQCGGDYYDALPLVRPDGAGRLLLCVADVSGKGLPAALVMSNMQATLRALLGRTTSLAELAGHAKRAALRSHAAGEVRHGGARGARAAPPARLTFVGAGHLDNLVLRASGEAVPLVSTGTPLGLLPHGMPYGESTHVLEPRRRARALLGRRHRSAERGRRGVRRGAAAGRACAPCAGQPAATLIDRTFQAIDAFAGGAPQFDDITVLVARRLPG